MIKIRIKNADHEIDIRFPISESELFAKLGEIHAVEGRDAAQSALVTDVYWPEEFSMLKDRFANLDELNYLGKRMESFDTLEYDQFLIGISKLDSKDVKDLINLTFNLNHFTLCQDVSSYGKEVSSRSPARGRRHRWRQRDGRTKADGSKEPSASQKQSEQKQTTEASSRSNRKGRQERRFSAITQAGDC